MGSSDINKSIRIEYMDTKNINNDEYYHTLFGLYQFKYSDVDFDVIISTDDNAFKFLLEYRDELFHDVQASFEAIEGAMVLTFEQLGMLTTNINNVDLNKNDALNSIQGISAITEENAAGAEEISATMDSQNELMFEIMSNSDNLNSIAGKLKEIISKFRV